MTEPAGGDPADGIAAPDPWLRAGPHVFVADLDAPALDEDDDHHLRRVLRLRSGDPLSVSDGAGAWRPVRLAASGALEPVGPPQRVAAPTPRLTVGVALPKGERPEWIVQKLTELGIDRVVLLEGRRSVVRWDARRAAHHLERLRKVARAAAMQSRRCWLPELDGPSPVAALAGASGVALAEPGGAALPTSVHTVLVGPEGGWDPDELALDALRVGLGPTVLRTETAAVAAGTLLAARRAGVIGGRA